MEFFSGYEPLFFIAIALGLYMAWGIGANDLSNSVGPAVGAGIFTLRQAIIIAIIFELAGAIFFGAKVTDTLSNKIIDLSIGDTRPMLLVAGISASLLAAALWLTLASARGWPVSTTHSIIGAMVGFAVAGIGVESVYWSQLGPIVASWLTSPVLGGALSFLLMKSISLLILNTRDPGRSAQRWVHLYVFFAAFLVCLAAFFNGIQSLDIDLTDEQIVLLAGFFAMSLTIIGMLMSHKRDKTEVEHAFVPITLFTVCSMAFAHGSNDVANSVGPMSLILSLLQQGDIPMRPSQLPIWIFLLGGVGIALGVATFGTRVVQTVGRDITVLTPCRAFTVALASTATIMLASSIGMPVSTTHTVIGAVLGVGLAAGAGAIQYSVLRKILASWLITLPFTALLAAVLFFILRSILGA